MYRRVHLLPTIYRTSIRVKVEIAWRMYIHPVASHTRELFYGLIRIHVLLHAAEQEIFGLAMMEELEHHGYRIGPGTLYPLLHGLERAGLLKSRPAKKDGRRRRLYRITAAGRKALNAARAKVDELHHELHEAHPRRVGNKSRRDRA